LALIWRIAADGNSLSTAARYGQIKSGRDADTPGMGSLNPIILANDPNHGSAVMAICNRCNVKMALAGTEAVDDVYEIHSWQCRSCGSTFQMAMACADPFDEVLYFSAMMQPEHRWAA
jgi:hypothetical protein